LIAVAILVPGLCLLAWTVLIYAPVQERQQDEAQRLATSVAAALGADIDAIRGLLGAVGAASEFTAADRPVCDAYLGRIVAGNAAGNSGLSNVFRLDLDGSFACSARPVPPGTNLANGGFFRRNMAQQTFELSGFLISPRTGRPVIVAAMPVFDPATGALRAIAGGALDLAILGKSLPALALPPGANLTILDADGRVLIRQTSSTDRASADLVGQLFPDLASLRQLTETQGILTDRQGHRLALGSAVFGPADSVFRVAVELPLSQEPETLIWAAWSDLALGVLLILAIGLAASRAILPRSSLPRSYAVAGFGALLLIGVGVGVIFRLMALDRDRGASIEYAHRVLTSIDGSLVRLTELRLHTTLLLHESGRREVLLALNAAALLERQAAEMADLVADDDEETHRAAQLTSWSGDLRGTLEALANLQPNTEFRRDLMPVATLDAIDDLLAIMKGTESQILARRVRADSAANRETIVVAIGVGTLALLLLLLAARLALAHSRGRALAEAALIDKERQYRVLAENMNEVVIRIGPDWTRHYVSPAAVEMLGWQPEQLVGRQLVGLVHPDDKPRLDLVLRQMFKGVNRADVAFRCRRADDSFFWAEGSYRAVPAADGTGTQEVIAVLRDVSRRVAAEEALRQRETQFRLITENIGDLIVCLDRTGTRTYASPSCQAVTGYTPEEFLAIPRDQTSHPEDLHIFTDAIQSMFTDRKTTCFEARAYHKDGRMLWIEARNNIVLDAETGEPIEIITIVRDVTERKQAASLLEQARRDAVEASRAKSEFLASMSHEIRTPMNGIIGFTTLLLSSEVTPEQQEMLQLLKESGESLLAIINDILDLSKIEAGALELEAIPVQLPQLVERAVALIDSAAAEKGLRLSVDIGQDVPEWVAADPTRLRQVLLNLLSNAVKFTASGGVSVRVCRHGDGRRILFEIQDTGIGIPDDRLHLLFRPFSQLDRSTSRRYGGTGLGLAICKHLVEAMGEGELGVSSAVGSGSRFWFAAALPPSAAPIGAPIGRGAAATKSARVLVIEDMIINQLVVEGILTRAGHKVAIAEDGPSGVEAVQLAGFDLVFMDIQMPGMNGLEATQAIRALGGRYAEIPIIALTANAMAEEIEQCRAAGMNDHLAKPIDHERLLECVARWSFGTMSNSDGQDLAAVATKQLAAG
jgi:PAS domain S-box-containing protein